MLVQHATLGLVHAHHPRLAVRHLLLDPTSRKCVAQCMMLNLLLFRGDARLEHLLLVALVPFV